MLHDFYTDYFTGAYPYAVLVQTIDLTEIRESYLKHLDIPESDVIAFNLYKDPVKKNTPKKAMMEYYQDLLEEFKQSGVSQVWVTDANYFKAITGEKQADVNIGYFFEVDGIRYTYLPNYKARYFNPNVENSIRDALSKINDLYNGNYVVPGSNVIEYSYFPKTHLDIKHALSALYDKPFLSCDIETFDLKFYKAGLGSISFSWSEKEGISFIINNDPEIKKLLVDFFDQYEGTVRYHNAAFDVTVLIYQLYMRYLTDQEMLLKGLEVLTRDIECTRIISYLATNSCAGNNLSLKDQAREFIGNYAVDVKDITKLDPDVLLTYNLQDSLSTNYVYNKNYPIMVQDNQQDIYENLFKPALIDIIQMQLTGMPICMDAVKKSSEEADKLYNEALTSLLKEKEIAEVESILAKDWAVKRNAKLKVKRVTEEDANITFNPNSGDHKRILLYEVLELPVLGLTKTKLPATDKDVMKSLIHHVKGNDTHERIITNLNICSELGKIKSSFLSHMLEAPYCDVMGHNFLFGNFNLGGTVSGRLSSSDINLQNIPSGSTYAALIKQCFVPPKGWLFVGLDFDSLEDKISALTTKDTNKLKIYMGHIIYEVCIDGIIHHVRDDAIINFDGKTYTGGEFYDTFGSL